MGNILLERRSIRSFINKEVNDSLIKEILYEGTMAPSAHNKQPWEFVVIKNNLLKQKISDLLLQIDELRGTVSSISKSAKIIKEVPVLILVFNKYEDHILFSTLSIGAAIQNILLSATNHSLGSLWIGNAIYAEEEICALLGKNMKLVSAIGLGYTEEKPNIPDRDLIDKITEWR